jgi:hypothetical protein
MPTCCGRPAVWPDGFKPIGHFNCTGVVSYQPALSLFSGHHGATERDVIVGYH